MDILITGDKDFADLEMVRGNKAERGFRALVGDLDVTVHYLLLIEPRSLFHARPVKTANIADGVQDFEKQTAAQDKAMIMELISINCLIYDGGKQ